MWIYCITHRHDDAVVFNIPWLPRCAGGEYRSWHPPSPSLLGEMGQVTRDWQVWGERSSDASPHSVAGTTGTPSPQPMSPHICHKECRIIPPFFSHLSNSRRQSKPFSMDAVWHVPSWYGPNLAPQPYTIKASLWSLSRVLWILFRTGTDVCLIH